MKLALLDILFLENFSNSEQTQLSCKLESIRQHLWRLFNTRQGSLSYLSDYGLPDLNQIYQDLPDSVQEFTAQIIKVIQKYEPRLTALELEQMKRYDLPAVIAYKIKAVILPSYPVLYSTYFFSGGQLRVEYS